MKNFPLIRTLHEETEREMHVPLDEGLWPASWKKVEFKEYPRMPRIPLPNAETLSMRFEHVLAGRKSRRDFDPMGSLSLQQLSNFLYWSAGISRDGGNPERSFRHYPSPGARYTLELYLALRGGKEFETGIYHYNVKNHALEQLLDSKGDGEIRKAISFPYAWIADAAAILFVGVIFDRTMRKYRERGYRFGLLESGIYLNNAYLVSEALQLGCCAFGTTVEGAVKPVLDLRDGESIVTQAAFGPQRS